MAASDYILYCSTKFMQDWGHVLPYILVCHTVAARKENTDKRLLGGRRHGARIAFNAVLLSVSVIARRELNTLTVVLSSTGYFLFKKSTKHGALLSTRGRYGSRSGWQDPIHIGHNRSARTKFNILIAYVA